MEKRPSTAKNPLSQPDMISLTVPAEISTAKTSASVPEALPLKGFGSRIQVLPGLVVFLVAFAVGNLAAFYTGSSGPPAAPAGVVMASGLKYVDLVEGHGASPQLGQIVRVDYIGWLENGREFENSYKLGTPYEFPVGPGLIPGWNEALQTMKVGGKRRITIPPHLAYGTRGRPPAIPPNATLIFEIELLGVR